MDKLFGNASKLAMKKEYEKEFAISARSQLESANPGWGKSQTSTGLERGSVAVSEARPQHLCSKQQLATTLQIRGRQSSLTAVKAFHQILQDKK